MNEFALRTSASSLGLWQKCPRMWAYFRLAQIPGSKQKSWAMVGGMAMDEALNRHLLGEFKGTALKDFYVTRLRELIVQEAPQGEPDNLLEIDGTRLLEIYERDVTPNLTVLEIQKKMERDFEGRPFQAHIDLIRLGGLGNKVIADHKFTKHTPPPDLAAKSLQLRAYDWLLDDPEHQVELISLIRLRRSPRVLVSPHRVSQDDRREFLRDVREANQGIDAGKYPAVPTVPWICRPGLCGAWSICKGRKEGPLPIEGERK